MLVAGPDPAGPVGADAITDGVAEGVVDGVGVAADEAAWAGAGLVCRAGALPRPPAPPGASTAAERVAGVASCQPTVTATGRPSATSPKKMDLGDNRT
jgi:hypothetical protein